MANLTPKERELLRALKQRHGGRNGGWSTVTDLIDRRLLDPEGGERVYRQAAASLIRKGLAERTKMRGLLFMQITDAGLDAYDLANRNLSALQDDAEKTARHIAAGRLPPDAGAIAKLRDTVAEAHRAGRAETMRLVLEAYQLYLDNDDIDGFRDTLTELSEGLPV